jgi:hypothetical protein
MIRIIYFFIELFSNYKVNRRTIDRNNFIQCQFYKLFLSQNNISNQLFLILSKSNSFTFLISNFYFVKSWLLVVDMLLIFFDEFVPFTFIFFDLYTPLVL